MVNLVINVNKNVNFNVAMQSVIKFVRPLAISVKVNAKENVTAMKLKYAVVSVVCHVTSNHVIKDAKNY